MEMSLGGGTFTAQNKVLSGAYINFVSASRASTMLSDRGTVAMPVALSWGNDTGVFTVTAEEFQKDSLKLFGFEYTDDEMSNLRELFAHAKEAHLFRVGTGGVKAECTYATAKYSGVCGNNLKIVITENEDSTNENPLFDVETFYNVVKVDEQKKIASMSDLKPNDFIDWKPTAELAVTAGTPLTGGVNGTVSTSDYQIFLDRIESYDFNILALVSTNEILNALFANFTKRMRDDMGIKFQCVLYRYSTANYEGVISVENSVVSDNGESGDLVYWVAGAQAGCAVNKSLSNCVYDGEYGVDTDYTQVQLEQAIKAGKFIFHKNKDNICVLDDINTFIEFTDDKNSDFSSNQIIRVLDQIGNDIADLFNTRYNGSVPNDNAGRISFWNDIVKHHQILQSIRAIEDFDPDKVTVEKGETKKSVVVTEYISPVSAMQQLYMYVIVQ
ncbi:hypothetical protein FACS1894198_3760 [Clostridia bacterium]|nr:hypothetical protein FACS1894198_3760 [Clostridia bacterium]